MIRKILSIESYGGIKEKPDYYFVYVCEVPIYNSCRNLNYFTEKYIVKDLNYFEVGDIVKIDTDYSCDFEDFLVVSTLEKY